MNHFDDEEEVSFVYPPSINLYCPICHELFKDPVITKECSHSFCMLCIIQADSDSCPLCRTKIKLDEVHSNLVLAQLINEQLVYCKYKKSGCSAQISFANRKVHEKQCIYGPSKCPHHPKGCLFQGTRHDVELHLKHCGYELLKDYIDRTDRQLAQLQQVVEMQANEIQEVKRKLELVSNGSILPKEDLTNSVSVFIPMNNDITNENTIQSPATQRATTPPKPLTEKEKWHLDRLECVQTLPGHTRGVTVVRFCPQTGYLFSGSHDSTIRVWDVSGSVFGRGSPDYKCLKILEGHLYTVWAIVVSQDGKRMYSGSSDGTIICWDTETFEQIRVISQVGGKIYTLLLKGNLLFSAGADRSIKVWEVFSFECIKQLIGHTECIWQLVVEGDYLYSSSDDRTIKVWSLRTYECVKTLHEESKILALAIGSGVIATGSDECKIKLYDIRTYECLATLSEHNWEVWQLSICDGLLFSGSFDHTIKVWDLETFGCLRTLTGHKGFIHALDTTPVPSKHLFSASGDKTIKVWKPVFETNQNST